MGSHINFSPKFLYAWGRRFDPQTSPYRTYTLPTTLIALIIGAFCSLQPRLSNHNWVQLSNFSENSGMPGGVPPNGDLTHKHHCIEHILSPRAPMALSIGAFGSSQPVLSEHVWVHMLISVKILVCPGGCSNTAM